MIDILGDPWLYLFIFLLSLLTTMTHTTHYLPPLSLPPKPSPSLSLSQVKSRPPTFAFFCNTKEIPGFFERFLRSRIQKDFKLDGVPIRMLIRKSKVRFLPPSFSAYSFITAHNVVWCAFLSLALPPQCGWMDVGFCLSHLYLI